LSWFILSSQELLSWFKIKNYCLDLFCCLDKNVNWIFLCDENVCVFFNVRLPTVPTLNEWLYTPYHFTVNINLIKELERRRKPISRQSKHRKLTCTLGSKSFWDLFEVFLGSFWGLSEGFLGLFEDFLRSFWGLFEVFLKSFLRLFLRNKEEVNLKLSKHPKLTCTLGSKSFWDLFEVFLRSSWGLLEVFLRSSWGLF